MIVSYDDVRFQREQLDYEIQAHLRRKGWEYTSGTPGSLWLYCRTIDGTRYAVTQDAALHIQEWLDMIASPTPTPGGGEEGGGGGGVMPDILLALPARVDDEHRGRCGLCNFIHTVPPKSPRETMCVAFGDGYTVLKLDNRGRAIRCRACLKAEVKL